MNERQKKTMALARSLRAAWTLHARDLAPSSLAYVLAAHVPTDPGEYWLALAARVMAERSEAAEFAEREAAKRVRGKS